MSTTLNPAEIRSQFASRESHIAEINYVTSGDGMPEPLVTVDCPTCAGDGYMAGDFVCRDCYGSGDITLSDLEEVAAILDLWS